MHPGTWWIRKAGHRNNPTNNRVSVRNAPRHAGDRTPVADSGEVTTQASHAIGNSQGGSGNISPSEPWNLIFPDDPRYRHRPAEQSAIPGKSGTGKNVARWRS